MRKENIQKEKEKERENEKEEKRYFGPHNLFSYIF